MSNGNFPIFPVPARPGCRLGDKCMTYRQHLLAQIAPVCVKHFLNDVDWEDYDDMAITMLGIVDAMIKAEKGHQSDR